MSLRLSDILRRGAKVRGLTPRTVRRRLDLDILEERTLLSNVQPTWVPTSSNLADAQNGPMANAGPGLINLYESYASYQALGSQGTFTAPASNRYLVNGNAVAIDVVGWGDESTFLGKLAALGMKIGGTNDANEIAEGWLSISQLPAVAEMDQTVDLSGITKAVTYQEGLAPNQSDRTELADAGRSQYGVDGTGVTVGVISDSANQVGGGIAASVATGDLPANVDIVDDSDPFGGTDEGRAMLEQVYDIAPGAKLAFATAEPAASPGDVGFANNILALANKAHANVIVDDLGIGDEPFFQNGVIGQAIDTVVGQGVTYLSAEGNSGPGGGYASQFRSVTTTVQGIGTGTYMNFNGSGSGASQVELAYNLTEPGGDLQVQWDNPYFVTNGVKTEVDAYLLDSTGAVVASATANAIANNQPVQDLDTSALDPGTYQLVLKVAKGPAPSYVEAISLFGTGSLTPPSSGAAGGTFFPSAWGHATDPNNIGVGAVAWWDASPFDGNINPTPNEPFSSSGPSLSIFSDAGVRQTAAVVNTPVISGADGNDISFSLDGSGDISTLVGQTPFGEPGTPTELDADGIPNFFGTSSATPNVGAVVALMLQANPAATPAQIKDALVQSGIPLNGATAGSYDVQGGFGLIQATTALRSINDHLTVSVSPPSGVMELSAITDYPIATFSDPGATGGAAAFTASVNWGDGTAAVAGQIALIGNNQYSVTSSHTYQNGGTFNVTVTVVHIAYSTRSGTAPITIVPYPISVTTTPPTIEEGDAFSGTIGTLDDTIPIAKSAAYYTTTISWSDGTTSPATLVPVAGQTNQYTILTTKTFDTPGAITYTITVTNTGTATASAAGGFTVTDAPLLPGAVVNFSPTEGQIFSGTVAKFVDKAYANSRGTINLPVSDYSATVYWGDGQSSPGLIQADTLNPGGFLIIASHRYATYGIYPFSAVIDDVAVPAGLAASSVTITNSVTVRDATLTAQGTAFGIVEGKTFNGTAATFQTGDPSAPIGDFSATINWGDGTGIDSNVTLVPTGQGGYIVRASHIFTLAGTYTGTVEIDDVGGSKAFATVSATVADAAISVSTTGLAPIATVEGQAFSGTLAILTDSNIYTTLSQYAVVTINWGDGTSSNLGDATNPTQLSPESGSPGVFLISDSHTYVHFGNYTITTTVTDVSGSSASAMLPATATAAQIVASGVPQILGQQGVAFVGTVATFTDTNPTPTLSDFTAQINWGDSTVTSGVIVQDANGGFSVQGTHIYTIPSSAYTISVTINDAAGQSLTVTSQADIPDASLTPISVVVTPTPTEGTRFNALVGQFTDSNPNPDLSTLTATIDWGDNTTSAGIILADNGKFDVRGTHVYAVGTYDIRTTVVSSHGAAAAILSPVTVAAAPLTSSPPAPITITRGTAYTGSTLIFTSANPIATPADFTLASIDWGDGSVTDATVSRAAAGFSVSGIHTYASVGTYQITTTVGSTGGATTTQTLQATVADATLTVKPGTPLATQVGSTATNTLATISYADLNSSPADFLASVNWGDGTVTTATVVPDPINGAGHFLVVGSHPYAAAGSYTISVGVNDVGGNSASSSLGITVADAPIILTTQPITSVAGLTFSTIVATFTSANAAAMAGSFTASINYGDGVTAPGTIVQGQGGVYDIVGTHTYAKPGTSQLTVTVASGGGSTAVVTEAVTTQVSTFPITAKLVSASTSVGGIVATNVSQPVFAGTGGPGQIITLTAQRLGLLGPSSVGQAIVDSNGQWALASTNLLDGTYSIVATATDAVGNVTSTPFILPTMEIDSVAPRITGVTLNPRTGQAIISIQDDASGLNIGSLANAANYSLTLPTLRGTQTIAITGITVSQGANNATHFITLNFASNLPRRHGKLSTLAAGRYVLTVNGTKLTDNAGNVLSESFFTLPNAPQANTGYVAQLVTNGTSIASPQTVKVQKVKVKAKTVVHARTVKVASVPTPSRFHKA